MLETHTWPSYKDTFPITQLESIGSIYELLYNFHVTFPTWYDCLLLPCEHELEHWAAQYIAESAFSTRFSNPYSIAREALERWLQASKWQ